MLDLNQAAQAGQGHLSTLEHGVILTASLVDRGLRARRAVGLVAHGDDLIWRPPQGGDEQRLRVLRELALVEPGELSLHELLVRLPPGLGRMASLIVITPDTSGAWLEALLPLTRRGVGVTALLIDPTTYEAAGTVPGELNALLSQLSRAGVGYSVLSRELLDRPEARPGQQGRWEWRVTPTGRAVPTLRPSESAWRELV